MKQDIYKDLVGLTVSIIKDKENEEINETNPIRQE